MDTLIYKLYVDNPVYVPGKSGTGYIGEATGVFSMNLDIPQAAAAQGIVANPGDNLTLVMTASFVDMDGETYTSPKSQSTAFTVPFPPGRVPVRPSAPNL